MKKVDVQNGRFYTGLFLGILLTGCASFTFPYKYYQPELKSWDGVLLGANPQDDLPASVCAPDDVSKGKCVVMKSEAFFKLKLEYLDLLSRLNDCERRP